MQQLHYQNCCPSGIDSIPCVHHMYVFVGDTKTILCKKKQKEANVISRQQQICINTENYSL